MASSPCPLLLLRSQLAFVHWRGRRYVLQVQPEPLRSL